METSKILSSLTMTYMGRPTSVFWVLAGIAALIVVGFFLGRLRGWKDGSRDRDRTTKINELEETIASLRRENEQYVLMDKKVADAVKFLTLNLSYNDVISHIIRLAKEIIPADFTGLYLYDNASGCLRLSSPQSGTGYCKRLYLPGDGMVGASAKNKMLVSRETDRNQDENPPEGAIRTRTLDIAAPILFNDELLGVLYVGGIHNPDGNEKRLFTMITSFAGVLLRNSVFIDDARQEANTDQLTGLYNRRFFFRKANEELVRARGYAYPLSVFMFDIDDFKAYNDAHGHTEGDALLVSLCDVVKRITRKTSVFARYGGEEFIVLLPNVDKKNALLYAERVRALTEKHPFPHKELHMKGFISISGGISEFPSDGDTIDSLVQMADEALYESKKKGKNRITAYGPSSDLSQA
jgi:diguanylate cyclase (GGDEF)-like protein